MKAPLLNVLLYAYLQEVGVCYCVHQRLKNNLSSPHSSLQEDHRIELRWPGRQWASCLLSHLVGPKAPQIILLQLNGDFGSMTCKMVCICWCRILLKFFLTSPTFLGFYVSFLHPKRGTWGWDASNTIISRGTRCPGQQEKQHNPFLFREVKEKKSTNPKGPCCFVG